MSDKEPVVKWLYPGAQSTSDKTSPTSQLSDMESEVATDQSVQGSSQDQPSEMDRSTPTTSGCDSETASVDEISEDAGGDIAKDLSNKMTAASSYVGSFFSASSWTTTTKASQEEETKEEATLPKSTSMTSSLFSAFGKVGLTKSSPEEEKVEEKVEDVSTSDQVGSMVNSASSYFTSAFSKMGMTTAAANTEQETDKAPEEEAEDGGNFLSFNLSKLGQAASTAAKSATEVIRDGVSKAPLIGEFNREQEEFIKNKEEKKNAAAPWIGYQNEAELKEKILALSEDKRNFVRAPPTGVNFDFEYATFAASAVALLDEDPKLQKNAL